MLQFKQDDISADIIVTLSENVVLPAPYYLFVFTHVTTKDIVAFVKAVADDLSSYPSRYNQFTLSPVTLFAGTQPGEWHYKVYQQVSASNVDTTLTGNVLEYGKLILSRAIDFVFNKYDSPTTYKTYNG